jgi:hypothetical protein
MGTRYFKIIACEIALREICHAAARSTNVLDLEFVNQGLHDNPDAGRKKLQEIVDAQPPDKYDALLIGYALCGNIIRGLRANHTPLVVPRAHDCITFFLGSRARYQQFSEALPSAYFYTSGWLECLRRRGESAPPAHPALLPTRAGDTAITNTTYKQWVAKYGEDNARHLLQVMNQWTENYTHGVLIDFGFAKPLHLHEQVQKICHQRGWEFQEIEGDLRLIQHWVDGEWDPDAFLVVPPGSQVMPSYTESVIAAMPTTQTCLANSDAVADPESPHPPPPVPPMGIP